MLCYNGNNPIANPPDLAINSRPNKNTRKNTYDESETQSSDKNLVNDKMSLPRLTGFLYRFRYPKKYPDNLLVS